nr:homeodomain-like protein [Tanacetum cinerariifolium]
MEYKGNDVVGALINIPIFVGTFSFLMDFAVLEDIDAYRDERMSVVIFSEPFLREVAINAKRFEGMITIYNGNESVTYQMVSHLRFKHHTNEQCNKISQLLKESKEDKMNGISHPYQKLKGFYKGVLNLGPDYIRDEKMEEWLTHRHVSVHAMECNYEVLGRYDVSVPALTKDHKGNKLNTSYPKKTNTPYWRRTLPEPGDLDREVLVAKTSHEQTNDELTDKKVKKIEADDQAIQTILMGLPKDIYAAVDSCEPTQEIWLRVQQMMKESDIRA